MKVWIFLLAAVATFAQQPQNQPGLANDPPKLARLEGTVLTGAGSPVPRAQLRLQGPTQIVNGTPSPGGNYSVTSDETGKFIIDNIEPASNLRLSATKTGFLTAQYGQRVANGPASPLALSAGQTLKGVVLTMTPQGVISGRVTDPNGDPIQGVQVMLQRRGYQRGVRALVSSASQSTNDQGEYRIPNVAAGRYYLQATNRNTASAILASSTNSAPEETALIPTYYPNGTAPQSAAPIDVIAGQEVRGMDIRMRQGRVFMVSGKVVSGTGEALQNPRMLVTPRTGGATGVEALITSLSTQTVRPDGTFQLRNLTPGPYTVQVALQVNNATRAAGSLDFDITDKNIADLVITTGLGGTITGRVRLENGDLKDVIPPAAPSSTPPSALDLAIAMDPAGAALAGVTGTGTVRMAVGLQPAVQNTAGAILGGNIQSSVQSDGNIKLENVGPGSYYLSSGAPQGTYVKAVSFNGTDVTRSPLVVTRGGGGTLEIVLARNPAGVTASVQNEKGEPMAAVYVSMWPQDPDQSTATGGVRTSQTNQSGTFTQQGLRAGTYYLAAFEAVDTGLLQARDFLTLLTSDATKVELKEGSTPTVQLKAISEAKVKAAEEKLP